MPTPTEEGWFWYTPSDGPKRPQPMQVVRDAQGHLHIGAPTCGSPHPGRAGGTWGERIPSSDQIKAMREVVAIDPHDNGDCCPLCHCWSTDDPPHDPTCPWIRAQDPPHAPTP